MVGKKAFLFCRCLSSPTSYVLLLATQVLGTPTEETWPGITKNQEFVKLGFPAYKPEPLAVAAPRFDSAAIDLLGKLLQFESKNRVPALDAMQHRYFESLGPRIHMLPNSESLVM